MARIRTIKPEFFTSEDIVSLSPLARLLYIALWCEADKEGRMAWKPRTFKMRYLPGDDCDIMALCQELVDAGVVRLYGDGLAYIPQFSRHQHINPRESESIFPAPDDACPTRAPRVSDASVTRREEGKGKEGREDASDDARSSYEPDGFKTFWDEWPKGGRKGGKSECLKLWRSAKLEANAQTIIAHVRVLKQSPDWLKQGGEFIPLPLTYLRGKRWDGAEVGPGATSQNDIFAGAI